MDKQQDQRNLLQEYSVPIGGAVIVLLVIIGGIWFWRSRTTTAPSDQTNQTRVTPAPIAIGIPQPESEVTMPTATPPPTVNRAAEEVGEEVREKGGELPKTGPFGEGLLALSFFSLASAYFLKRAK